MARTTTQRRINLDPRGGPLYKIVRDGQGNNTGAGIRKTVQGGVQRNGESRGGSGSGTTQESSA
jgi:hypothetical protein